MTLWYSAILLIILLIFGAIVDAAVRAAINGGVDYDLQVRLEGLESFMLNQIPRFPRARLPHQFEEHSVLRPGGETMQIADSSGNCIFQSDTIRSLHLPAVDENAPGHAKTLIVQGVPVRVRSAVVRVNGEPYYVQLATLMSASYVALDRFRLRLLALIPLMVVVSLAGGYWLSSRALAPVDKIIEDAQSITLQSIARRLPVPRTNDELQRLAETLNEMMQRLEGAFRRITQFTADASHELRAPMAFIRTTAEVALLAPRSSESYRSALADILEEGEWMTKLIDDLLTLARADAGSSELTLSQVDLCKPLREACRAASVLAERKKIRFCEDLPQVEASALGDADALRRLFVILLDNAVKYTPSKGSVEVGLAVTKACSEVLIRDSGVGIAVQDIDHIFERFYRADKARQRDSGGVGLGLSIARWIADVHSAQILVESKLNSGSTFRVRFPKRSPPPTP
ncbi:MAG TPA: ATP-binding protein [Bryobacteraceae bacterium]|nr:ATP-binding protein [Bryobacteraceae bacterium]